MFSRSDINRRKSSTPNLSCPVKDREELTVKSAAEDSPSRLGLRIAEGDDVIAIWSDWERQNSLQAISQKIGFAIPSVADQDEPSDVPSIYDMDTNEILAFCQQINVHPAHLVPLQPKPELSLPKPLLELLIDMTRGQGKYLAEDIELARVAVAIENKRISSFLYYQSLHAKPTETDGGSPVTLVQVFESVLDNPNLMRKLMDEATYLNYVLEQNSYTYYPLATRVKDYALHGLQSKVAALTKAQKNQETILNAALDSVKTGYSQVFYSVTNLPRLLLFIGDIKDGLLSKDIEPRAATIENIADVLDEFDFRGSNLQKAYRFFNDAYGDGAGMKESGEEFLTELAENVALYFASEDRLSKAKRRTSKEIDALPLKEDIEALFKAENFQEGRLFRRLMDNRVLIALSSHENRAQPMAAP